MIERICIVGAGTVGGDLGAHLNKAGVDLETTRAQNRAKREAGSRIVVLGSDRAALAER